MSPVKHVISGISLGTGLYYLTGDKALSVTAAISSFLCDIDHLAEYAYYCISFHKNPSIKEFFTGKYFEEKGTIYILLHGYEYLILLYLLYLLNKSKVICGALLGYGLHLMLDTIGNDCTLKGYFILNRRKHEWSLNKICTKK